MPPTERHGGRSLQSRRDFCRERPPCVPSPANRLLLIVSPSRRAYNSRSRACAFAVGRQLEDYSYA